MPLDDFRKHISDNARVDFEMLRDCADRYQVSLIATVLRWLGYTKKRAILVVSRDGFILWTRSSEPALMTGAYFKTSQGPIEIPATALPLNPQKLVDGRGKMEHPRGVWLREPALEMTILAEQCDFSLSLLLLDDVRPLHAEAEPVEDAFDRFAPPERRREW